MKKQKSNLYVINYATEDFENIRSVNSHTAIKYGRAKSVFEYSSKDIDSEFYATNSHILDIKRGAGLWLWKPYVINKALSEIDYDDYLFYSDSGAVFVGDLSKIVDYQQKINQDIIPFELPLIEEQWTKEECFVELNCLNDEYKKTNQILATYFLIKKTLFTVRFINEYLSCCTNIRALSSFVFNDSYINTDLFIAHREDQSIFSLLCKKNKLTPFKEPSQFGCRPWLYSYANVLYNPIQRAGDYPLCLISVRSISDYKLHCMKELLKCFLARFRWYKNREITIRRNVFFKI